MRTLAGLLFASYLGLHFIVFVFHPLSGPFLALSRIVFPAGIVDGRPVWYPRVATFAQIARAEDSSLKKGEAVELGLQEAVYEARVRNILKQEKAPFDQKNKEDPVMGVIELSRATNAAVFSSTNLQNDVKLRLEGLRSRIVDGGMPFTDAALRYSEHSSARISGDLGQAEAEDAPDWMKPIFDMEQVPVSKPINGPDSYWLFHLKPDETKGSSIPSGRLYGIAFEKKELPYFISKAAKNDRPWIFVW